MKWLTYWNNNKIRKFMILTCVLMILVSVGQAGQTYVSADSGNNLATEVTTEDITTETTTEEATTEKATEEITTETTTEEITEDITTETTPEEATTETSGATVKKPENTSLTAVIAGEEKITVRWNKHTKYTAGYQIQYSTAKDFSKNSKTITIKSNKTTVKTIKKLKAKKKYYVRIRTYKTVNGVRYKSSWSEARAVTVKKVTTKTIVSTNHQKYSYEELTQDLKQLQARYSENCQVNVIGQSADSRNIYEVVLGNQDAKKHMLVIANLHAREYMTTQLCMKQIEYYLQNYNKKIDGIKVSDVLDKVCIHIVPSCNPDGTAISQYGFSAIRNTKLRNALYKMGGNSLTWKANARGVDLNMNWDIGFTVKNKKGSAGYSGKKAASESEVQAIINLIDSIQEKGSLKGIISYHSEGSIIYGRCSDRAQTSVAKVTNKMYKVAKKETNYYLYGTGVSANQSREYFIYVRNIPCITLEIGKGSSPLPSSQFSSIWKKNKNLVIKEAALFK
jgi:g-D-glutamyl-meso-diaminopimelate peptidase